MRRHSFASVLLLALALAVSGGLVSAQDTDLSGREVTIAL